MASSPDTNNFQADLVELREILMEYNRVQMLRPSPDNQSNSNITFNTGGSGVAVWICVTACLLMMTISAMTSFFYTKDSERIEAQIRALQEDSRSKDILLAGIWQQAPQLKPKDYDNARYNPNRDNSTTQSSPAKSE
jgi:hypothetical protein